MLIMTAPSMIIYAS